MITGLRSKRNRPYLHTLVFVLLVSWLSVTMSATCTMPSVLMTASAHQQGCSDAGEFVQPHHHDYTHKAMQVCSLKACPDSQTNPFTDFIRMTKPDVPVFILSFIWIFWCLFLTYPLIKAHRKTDPPLGRRILLIYRFCTLLN